jgi:hypothetical protein
LIFVECRVIECLGQVVLHSFVQSYVSHLQNLHFVLFFVAP